MALEKAEFRNTLDGVYGVVIIEPGGKQTAIPLQPGETVWLSEDEQILTANSHKAAADNPFVEREIEHVDGDKRWKDTLPPILELITTPRPIASGRPIGKPAPQTTASGTVSAPAPAQQPAGPAPSSSGLESEDPPEADAGADAEPDGEPEDGEQPEPIADAEGPAGAPVEEVTAGAGPEDPEASGDSSQLESDDEVRGAAVSPDGPAPEGQYGSTEEVATPMAPARKK